MSDATKLRGFLEDMAAVVFTDDDITGLLTLANDNVAPTGSLTLNQLYYAAHLGWIRKAGKVRVKDQRIAIFAKKTKPAFDAALEMAEMYKELSLGEGDIGVQIPCGSDLSLRELSDDERRDGLSCRLRERSLWPGRG